MRKRLENNAQQLVESDVKYQRELHTIFLKLNKDIIVKKYSGNIWSYINHVITRELWLFLSFEAGDMSFCMVGPDTYRN